MDKNGSAAVISDEQREPDTANIRFVIELTRAEHLDSNREFISDIYEEIRALDDIWSENIYGDEYVRVTFEESLSSENDIKIYSRIISGNPKIEVYEKDRNELIAEFKNLEDDEYSKVLLTNLVGKQDTFDLKIIDGIIKIDYIIDPRETWYAKNIASILADCTTNVNMTQTVGSAVTTATLSASGQSFCSETPAVSETREAGVWNVTVDFTRGGGSAPDPTASIELVIVNATGSINEVIASCTGVSVTNNLEYTCANSSVPQRTLSNERIRINVTATNVVSRSAIVNYDGPSATVGDTRITLPGTIADNPPQWFDNTTNSTSAGEAVEHRVYWTDDITLSGYIFEFDNGTGTFTNDSWVSMPSANWSNVTKVVNSTAGSTIRWRVYTNDSINNWNVTDIFQYTTTVDNPPQWYDPSVNDSTPTPPTTVRHNINWTDENALSFAYLEINSTGANCDTSANVSSTTLSGLSQWANLSWQVPDACEDKTIGWRQYVNDSSNQWNATDLQAYQVQNVNPIASFGTNPVDNYNSSSQSITFDLKVSDNLNVNGLSLYGNWSGTWSANQTNATPINDTYLNVTVTGIPEGYHVWGVWGNDTSGNFDFTNTNRTFIVDITKPSVTINSPLNQNYTTNSITFNVTATDSFDVNSCQYSLDGASNVSMTEAFAPYWNNTNTSMTQGSHKADFYCHDSVGNINGTESVPFFIDSLVPQILFTTGTEENDSSRNQQFVFANVSVTESNFANITYKLYNSTGEVNSTTYTTLVTTINWTGLDNTDVQYLYNVSTYDDYGNFNETETRYITLTQDNPPTVTIVYPANTTYNSAISEINYSASDDNSVDACWYSTDGGASNSTPDFTCANFTGLSSSEGLNNWAVYANDSAGQESSDSVTFLVDSINPLIDYTTGTPVDNANLTQNYIFVNISVTESNFANITYKLHNSTSEVNTTTYTSQIFQINWTGLSDDTYTYNVTIVDNASNENSTATRTATIDTGPPSVSSLTEYPSDPATFSSQFYWFNATVTDPNLDTVLIEFDGVNYSTINW
ncbi:MAG: hypothetical protein ACW99A_21300, partial [Candidatus Kariarchaeaceae archaeon]